MPRRQRATGHPPAAEKHPSVGGGSNVPQYSRRGRHKAPGPADPVSAAAAHRALGAGKHHVTTRRRRREGGRTPHAVTWPAAAWAGRGARRSASVGVEPSA